MSNDRLLVARERFLVLQGERDALMRRQDVLVKEIEDLDVDIAELAKVAELFKYLLDQIILDNVRTLSAIVSRGLQEIFPDQRLGFEAEVVHRRDKVEVNFYSTEVRPSGETIRGPALEAFGGGVSAIESLLLRVITVLKTKLARVLILDESLAAVSDSYLPGAGQFLRALVNKVGMDVLLVTHKRAFLDFADVAYEAEPGKGGDLRLTRIRG